MTDVVDAMLADITAFRDHIREEAAKRGLPLPAVMMACSELVGQIIRDRAGGNKELAVAGITLANQSIIVGMGASCDVRVKSFDTLEAAEPPKRKVN